MNSTRHSSRFRLARTAAAVVLFAAVVPLSGCLALQIPTGGAPAPSKAPTPVETETDDTPDDGDPLETLTFADGLTLSADTHIEWSDGLMFDDEWVVEAADNGNGSWSYRTSSGECTAVFWQGTLDGLESSGDDSIASDAIIGVVMGLDVSEVTSNAYSGTFSYQTGGNRVLDGRAVAGDDGDRTWMIAARGFAQVGVGMSVITDCTSGSAVNTMEEVLDKNALIVLR